MNGRALLVAAVLSFAARTGRADETAAPPVAKADHVVMKVAERTVAGWPVAPDAKQGSILLTDEGAFVTIARDRKAQVVSTDSRPVTEIPGSALVDGLAHDEESVRDRCQELLVLRGAEAEPLLALALAAKPAEARRRALAILAHAPIARLAAPVRNCVGDVDEGVRAAALDAYVKLRRNDALRVCVESLEGDHSLLVQHSAIERVGELGDIRGVDPLLDHLANCEERSIRIVTFAALRKITGKSLGRDEEAWRAWWTNHRDELMPDDEEIR